MGDYKIITTTLFWHTNELFGFSFSLQCCIALVLVGLAFFLLRRFDENLSLVMSDIGFAKWADLYRDVSSATKPVTDGPDGVISFPPRNAGRNVEKLNGGKDYELPFMKLKCKKWK